MSEQAVAELIQQLVRDDAFRKEFERDRASVLNREGVSGEADFTEEERRALERLDVNDLQRTVHHLADLAAARVGSLYI